MIKHIVMIKLKDFTAEKEKSIKIKKLKSELDLLKKTIQEIKYFETGLNVSKAENAFDLVIISVFNSLEDLEKYKIHPDHQIIVKLIKKLNCDTRVVDFEF